MANENFQKTIETIKNEAINLALTTFSNFKNEAKADALKLVENVKENLKTWTLQLAEGKLSKEDFEFLVLGQKELIEMNALRQAGVKLNEAEKFKSNLLALIAKTVIGIISLA